MWHCEGRTPPALPCTGLALRRRLARLRPRRRGRRGRSRRPRQVLELCIPRPGSCTDSTTVPLPGPASPPPVVMRASVCHSCVHTASSRRAQRALTAGCRELCTACGTTTTHRASAPRPAGTPLHASSFICCHCAALSLFFRFAWLCGNRSSGGELRRRDTVLTFSVCCWLCRLRAVAMMVRHGVRH